MRRVVRRWANMNRKVAMAVIYLPAVGIFLRPVVTYFLRFSDLPRVYLRPYVCVCVWVIGLCYPNNLLLEYSASTYSTRVLA